MIAYDLEIQTPLTVDEVAERFVDVAGELDLLVEETDPRVLVGPGFDLRTGTWVQLTDWTHPPGHAIEDILEPGRVIWLHFRLAMGTPTGVAPQEHEVIRLVQALLERVPGDCVFHFEYEVVWLVRRDGRLYLNARDDIWRPEYLAMVRLPYQRAALAFPSVMPADPMDLPPRPA